VHENIVSVGVKTFVEHEGCVHEWAWVNKTSPLFDYHLLYIENETTIKNLESLSAFSSKDQNFIVSDLVRQSHVGRNPLGLVNHTGRNFLPDIPWNVITFNSVNKIFLGNTATEGEHIVVLERTQADSGTGNSHLVDDLPLVLLSVILLTLTVDFVINKSSHDIDEALDWTHWMVCMRVVHILHRDQGTENFVVSVAGLEIDVQMFDVATGQVDSARFSCDAAGVKWDLILHRDWFLLKGAMLYPVNLAAPLVPLKWMQALRQQITKWTFDIIVDSKVAFY